MGKIEPSPMRRLAGMRRLEGQRDRRELLATLAMGLALAAAPGIVLAGDGGDGGGDGGGGGGGGSSSGTAPGSVSGASVGSAASVSGLMGDQGERVIIIDVRPKGDFARGRLRGAINLQVRYSEVTRAYQFDKSLLGNDKSKPVVVYGANEKDAAAANAVRAVVAEGFTNVIWMRGGFAEWVAARMPTAVS